MKNVLALVMVLSTITLHAQNEGEDLVIGFACAAERTETVAVRQAGQFLADKSYKGVAGMLRSGNPAKNYMAVIVLEKLQSEKKYSATPDEMALIKDIKNSEMIVWLCEGSNFWEKHSLRDVFRKYPEFGKWWLEEKAR